jgi:hypothetical protein
VVDFRYRNAFRAFHSAAQRRFRVRLGGWAEMRGLSVWHARCTTLSCGTAQRIGTCGKRVDEGAERVLEIGKGVAVDLQQ